MAALDLILSPAQFALVAAAPDLLKAAELATSVLRSQGMYDQSERMAVERLEAAIAKARGQVDHD